MWEFDQSCLFKGRVGCVVLWGTWGACVCGSSMESACEHFLLLASHQYCRDAPECAGLAEQQEPPALNLPPRITLTVRQVSGVRGRALSERFASAAVPSAWGCAAGGLCASFVRLRSRACLHLSGNCVRALLRSTVPLFSGAVIEFRSRCNGHNDAAA